MSSMALDTNGSNPFWPKNMTGGEAPDSPATNAITIDSITFANGDPTVNVTTTPAGSAWSVDWGDGGAVEQIAAGTNSATHTYANKTAGTQYTLAVTSGTDTDSRNIRY